MKNSILYLLLIIPIAFVATILIPGCKTEREEELKQLKGGWQAISEKLDGKDAPVPEEGLELSFEEGKYIWRVGKEVKDEGDFRANPTTKPKAVELTPSVGIDKGKTRLGIYDMRGEELWICVAPAGKSRPVDFSCRPGDRHHFAIFKRLDSSDPRAILRKAIEAHGGEKNILKPRMGYLKGIDKTGKASFEETFDLPKQSKRVTVLSLNGKREISFLLKTEGKFWAWQEGGEAREPENSDMMATSYFGLLVKVVELTDDKVKLSPLKPINVALPVNACFDP
jgi:uncharacterized protein (TIGR03067 family)